MSEQNFVFKIMLIGDPSVGKTSLIRRFVEDRFSEDYISSMGVDFLKKNVDITEKVKVTLVLWDIAGQSKYATFKKAYYSGSDFIIVVFDITKIKTYQNITRWLGDAQAILGEDTNFSIFANKVDLVDQRQVVDYTEFEDRESLLEIIETSAKTGQNVEDIFTKIAKFLLKRGGVTIEGLDLEF